jgi:hypothetical protein
MLSLVPARSMSILREPIVLKAETDQYYLLVSGLPKDGDFVGVPDGDDIIVEKYRGQFNVGVIRPLRSPQNPRLIDALVPCR